MYKICKEIIVRDIGKIYFLVDIKEKSYLRSKKIYSVNHIGKALFEIMEEQVLFDTKSIAKALINKLEDYDESMDMQISADIDEYISKLLTLEYIVEVS